MIPEENREQFIQDLFWNMREVHDVNAELAKALESRQKASSPIVDQIGDIMLQHVASFGPFVQYGAHQMVSRYVLETEKSTNPAFMEFVEVLFSFHAWHTTTTRRNSCSILDYRKITTITQAGIECLLDKANHAFGPIQFATSRDPQAYPCRPSRSGVDSQSHECHFRVSKRCQS